MLHRTGGPWPRRSTPRSSRSPALRSCRALRIEKYDLEVGLLGHLAAERARLAALRWPHFDARRLGAMIGAEISGVEAS